MVSLRAHEPRARTAAARTSRAAVVASAGFRRASRVEIRVGSGPPTATVHGVVHRYPGRFPVSLATADRLADAGVPLVIAEPRR